MTNLKALQSTIGSNYPFADETYLKALIDANINPTADYSSTNTKVIDLCVAGLIPTLILAVDLKEGGYSVTVGDRAALLALRKSILNKYGIPDGSATINDASNLW